MHLLISGVAGFIGFHIAKHFLNSKVTITGFDNLSEPFSAYKTNHIRELTAFGNFEFRQLDLLDQTGLARFLQHKQIDYFIHLAAKTGVRASARSELEYQQVNVLGTKGILEILSQKSNKPRIIVFSSSSVYGSQISLPANEEAPLLPVSNYGKTKVAMEKVVHQMADQFPQVVILRPFSVYGPDGRQDMAPYLLFESISKSRPFVVYGNNSTNQRDWTYIDDLVKAVARILSQTDTGLKTFNIAGNQPIGINDFVALALRNFPHAKLQVQYLPSRSDETSKTWGNTNLIRQTYGWYPTIPFHQGIDITMKYFFYNV